MRRARVRFRPLPDKRLSSAAGRPIGELRPTDAPNSALIATVRGSAVAPAVLGPFDAGSLLSVLDDEIALSNRLFRKRNDRAAGLAWVKPAEVDVCVRECAR